jgi:hypothetical protein
MQNFTVFSVDSNMNIKNLSVLRLLYWPEENFWCLLFNWLMFNCLAVELSGCQMVKLFYCKLSNSPSDNCQ